MSEDQEEVCIRIRPGEDNPEGVNVQFDFGPHDPDEWNNTPVGIIVGYLLEALEGAMAQAGQTGPSEREDH